MPSSRITLQLAVSTLALAVICAPLAGCGRTSAVAPSPAGGVAVSATSSAAASKPPVKPPVNDGVVAIAPASTLQPPAFDGFEPLPCFTYHHVDPKLKNEIAITPATFESQLKVLASLGFHPITARQLYDHQFKGTALPDKPVMITFDDGWRNQYTYAAPLLKKYGMVATFFINPAPIANKYRGYLTREMVLTLAQGGNDIESHTWRHFKVTRGRKDSADAFQRKNVSQLTLANDWIRQVVGVQPAALCYPYGYYDLEAIGMAQKVGYKLGFTTDEGIADARPWDAFQIKRFTISNLETAASFKRRLLSGALPVRDIRPAPASRVIGIDATVTVDISEVPSNVTKIRLSSGPALRRAQIIQRNGHKYAEAAFRNAKVGFREITIRGTDENGRAYYASWGIVLGDTRH